MVLHTITGNPDYFQTLKNKQATFMLAMSNTATANIEGITQAGIPGMLHLTPVLDAEFLATGEVRSLPNIAETPKGVPTPALITRAIHLLHPFAHVELLDLGLEVQPQGDDLTIHHFDIAPSQSIAKGANIDAKEVFEKGYAFGKNYACKDDYLILGESVPSGTTTATATALALGYDAKELFSSSFKNVPNNIRQETINKALVNIEGKTDLFDILGTVSDNMLIFNAGFILGVNSRFPIVLAGGTQMSCVLLVANSIVQYMGTKIDSSKLTLATTKWVAQDDNSDIKALLEMLDFPIDAYYSNFDFSLSNHPALKLYDEGEAKEGVGAGGALVYGILNGLGKEDITKEVEGFLG
ncbi:MAG: TIGR00303 family protein [Epsilonproteobacteria bacterium]|nr:TIGR00303 family protein [Campylobacterota bacterium]